MEFALRCWHIVPLRLSQRLSKPLSGFCCSRLDFVANIRSLREGLSQSTCVKSKSHYLGPPCSELISRIQ